VTLTNWSASRFFIALPAGTPAFPTAGLPGVNCRGLNFEQSKGRIIINNTAA
jgi:hypothetical protein